VIPTDDEAPENLARIVLGKTEFAFIGPLDLGPWEKPLSRRPPDLSEVPLVAPIFGLERKRLNEFLRARKVDPHIVAEVRGNEGIIAMVRLGAGVALVPRLVLESSPLKNSVQELRGIKPPRGYEVSLCTRRRNLERRIIQLFWKLAEEGV
jgi:LysR family positive regulator for ilvC